MAEEHAHAGARVLSVLENPLNARILSAHTCGPRRLAELQKEVTWAAQSTIRAALTSLREIGALRKVCVGESPYAVATELTAAGADMARVVQALEVWLSRHPGGAIRLDGEQAKAAMKALVGGWSSNLMHALACGKFTLTQLHRQVPEISYPALERRIAWMRAVGQIEALEKKRRGQSYMPTEWLRHSVAPLSLAARAECRHLSGGTSSVTKREIEAALLLAVPLAPVPEDWSASCSLVIQAGADCDGDGDDGLATIELRVAGGRVVSASAGRTRQPASWALATVDTWWDAIIDGRLATIRYGGLAPQLPANVLAGLHFTLFESSKLCEAADAWP
jgi:DNA-binding HxlR family transcriptional regulator